MGGDAGGGPAAMLREPGAQRTDAGGESLPGIGSAQPDTPNGQPGGLGAFEDGGRLGGIEQADGDKGPAGEADEHPMVNGDGFGGDAGAKLDGLGGIEAEQRQDGSGIPDRAKEPGEPAGVFFDATATQDVSRAGGTLDGGSHPGEIPPNAAVLHVLADHHGWSNSLHPAYRLEAGRRLGVNRRNLSDGVVFEEDAGLAGFDEDLVAAGDGGELEGIVGHIDAQSLAGFAEDLDADDGSGGLHADDARAQGGGAIGGAFDLKLMRADEDAGGGAFALRFAAGGFEGEAADHGAAGLDAAMEEVDVAEEVHHELGGGMVEDLVGGAGLFDAGLVHDDDAVGDFEGFVLVVGDEDAGDVEVVVEAAEPLAEVLADAGVERAEGFVEQQDAGFDGDDI